MRQFTYARADDVDGALAATREAGEGAMFIGGGTNLVDLMKLGVLTPSALVDVSRLRVEEAHEVRRTDEGLRVGAAVRNSEIAVDPQVRHAFPVLSQALLAGASPQLRNLATVGGNLLQRTRCTYFQDVTTPCNKREPGSGCSAVGGEHRTLAVLGASEHCIATHPSDMAVAMSVLDARVRVREPEPEGSGQDGSAQDGAAEDGAAEDGAAEDGATEDGAAEDGHGAERVVLLEDLHRLPGDAPERETTLAPGTLITAVDLPLLPDGARSAYRKVRDRASYAFAAVSVAAVLVVEDGVVRDVRIGLGAVAHKPWRARTAERALVGGPATREAFAGAMAAELEAAEPLPGNAFKVPLVQRIAVSVLLGLAGQDGQQTSAAPALGTGSLDGRAAAQSWDGTTRAGAR